MEKDFLFFFFFFHFILHERFFLFFFFLFSKNYFYSQKIIPFHFEKKKKKKKSFINNKQHNHPPQKNPTKNQNFQERNIGKDDEHSLPNSPPIKRIKKEGHAIKQKKNKTSVVPFFLQQQQKKKTKQWKKDQPSIAKITTEGNLSLVSLNPPLLVPLGFKHNHG